MRVLVTGSRTWTDRELIYELIRAGKERFTDLIVVHGGCPNGADRIAELVAHILDLETEVHRADWKRHGQRAGFLRNKAMVDTKPDLCLAFIHHKSPGATMCANLAEKAGIPTHRYTEEQQ